MEEENKKRVHEEVKKKTELKKGITQNTQTTLNVNDLLKKIEKLEEKTKKAEEFKNKINEHFEIVNITKKDYFPTPNSND